MMLDIFHIVLVDLIMFGTNNVYMVDQRVDQIHI